MKKFNRVVSVSAAKKLLIGRIFTILLLLLIGIHTYGYGTAVINNVWVESDAQRDGEKGIRIHVDFNAKGVKGNTLTVTAYLYDDNKQKVMGGISGYKTKSGHVSIHKSDVSDYENCHWKDFKMFIPEKALPFPAGKHNYYVMVIVKDKTQDKTLVKSSEMHRFAYTLKKMSQYNDYADNHERPNNSTNTTKTWKELTTNGFVIVTQYPDGSKIRARFRPCLNCKATVKCGICYGTGRCSLCSGRGAYLDRICASCRGTRTCAMCSGTGKCRCSTTDYPGYVLGSMTTVNADGSTSRERFDYGSGGSSSQQSSSKGACTACGGTGVDPNPSHGGSLASWIAYTNGSGDICPYCHYADLHQHTKCARCNVPSR